MRQQRRSLWWRQLGLVQQRLEQQRVARVQEQRLEQVQELERL